MEQKLVNENLIDNKMMLRMKENIVRNYYEKIFKSTKSEIDTDIKFEIKLKNKHTKRLSKKRHKNINRLSKRKL